MSAYVEAADETPEATPYVQEYDDPQRYEGCTCIWAQNGASEVSVHMSDPACPAKPHPRVAGPFPPRPAAEEADRG